MDNGGVSLGSSVAVVVSNRWKAGLLKAEDVKTHICAKFTRICAKFRLLSAKLVQYPIFLFMFLKQSDKVLNSILSIFLGAFYLRVLTAQKNLLLEGLVEGDI